MTLLQLTQEIRTKGTFLCVGLDTDVAKLPSHLPHTAEGIWLFNKHIIDHTADQCVSYKINTAFYESLGSQGWEVLERTVAYLRASYPDHFTIADAKRGDIGNTSSMYARAFFEQMDFHAVTVAPYMGADSIEPFLQYSSKYTILLALTSNPGSADFEELDTPLGKLYEQVLLTSQRWKGASNLMYVVGATKPDQMRSIRSMLPEAYFLVPGMGAQGGNLHEVSEAGLNERVGMLVNSSRAIIYASNEMDFALRANAEAERVHKEMKNILDIKFNQNGK